MPTKYDLEKRLDETRDILKALGKALDALSSSMGLEDLFGVIVEGMTKLGYDLVFLQLLDEENGILRFQERNRDSAEANHLIEKLKECITPTLDIPLSEVDNISVKAIRDGEVYTSQSIYDAVRPLGSFDACNQAQRDLGLGITAAVPLIVEGRAAGVLIANSTRKEVLTTDEIQVLKLFANQAAWAIEKERLYSILKDISVTDPLTGLPNRRTFIEQIKHLASVSNRRSFSFSILFIDVDNLKEFNDKYGHQAGDDLLKAVGNALRTAVRSEDVVCRYGGDEFVVLLQGLDSEKSLEVAKRAQAAAHKARVRSRGSYAMGQVSIGIASYPQHGLEGEDLINKSDAAMYEAKRSGGGRISIYEPS